MIRLECAQSYGELPRVVAFSGVLELLSVAQWFAAEMHSVLFEKTTTRSRTCRDGIAFLKSILLISRINNNNRSNGVRAAKLTRSRVAVGFARGVLKHANRTRALRPVGEATAMAAMHHAQSEATPSSVADHFTALQFRAIAFCFLLFLIDGADVLVVSYAAPALSREWGIAAEQLGLVFSAGLGGMTIGALFLAPLSDRFGRKTLILTALVIVGGGMIASGFAHNVETLIALRLFVGLGIGSMLASIAALADEFSPPSKRASVVTGMTAGYPAGAILSGIVATQVIPMFGWQGLFIAAGIVSLSCVPLCLALMPESLSFLRARQPRRALERVNAMRQSMGLDLLDELGAPSDAKRANAAQLLTPAYRRATLTIWAAFFLTFMTLYYLTSWIPKIAVDAGLPLSSAIYAGATFNLGALVGVFTLGWLASRLSITAMIALFFVGGPIAMVLFGYAHAWLPALFLEIFAMGFFVQGGFSGLYAIATRAYPTAIRTTGVGWGLGAGRLGAVFGPYLGGLAIANGVPLEINFLLFAAPVFAAGLIVLALGRVEAPAG